MTDIQRRFLQAIAAKVAPERIAELHLFPSLRQGQAETGVAVVAEATDGAEGAPERHVVHSARYRLVLKGMERGKWECEVVAEADAPLVTVEAVVRGVRDRSEDGGEPSRFDGDAVRALLAESATGGPAAAAGSPAWTTA